MSARPYHSGSKSITHNLDLHSLPEWASEKISCSMCKNGKQVKIRNTLFKAKNGWGGMSGNQRKLCWQTNQLVCKVRPTISTVYQTQVLNGCWTLTVCDCGIFPAIRMSR